MSPELLFAVLSLSVAGTAAAPAVGPVGCVLMKNTAVERFQLSTLTPLFGELLTTESNGNKYFVSVCSPISREFYDPRRLAGAVKLTAEGHSIELGRIDISNVIVNENDIVLTYDGGDVDKNPKDTCKGLRWNTYVTFTCDPHANKDVLILRNEDPDQPEICQVWFEIKTWKICDRQPYITLHSLEKDLSIEEKQIHEKEESRRNGIYFNDENFKNKPSDNENRQLDPHRISPKTEIEEKKLNEIDFNNTSSEHQPGIYVKPNFIHEKESISNREKENKFNQYFSPKTHSFYNENNNIIEKNEKANEEIENGNSNLAEPKEHIFTNKSPSDYERETKSQDTKSEDEHLRNKSENNVKTEKSKSYENKNSNMNRFMPKDLQPKKNLPWEKENKENSSNTINESYDNKNENPRYENPIYVHKEFISNREKENKLNQYFLLKNHSFNYDHNYFFEKNEKVNEEIENGNSTLLKPKEHFSTNKNPLDYKNKTNSHGIISEDEQLRNKRANNVEKEKSMSYENKSTTQFMPNDQLSKKNVPWEIENKENSWSKNNESSDNKNGNLRNENTVYDHKEDNLNTNLPEEEWSKNERYNFETNKNKFIPNNMSKNKMPSDKTNVKQDESTNSEKENKIKISPEETTLRNDNRRNISNQNTPEGKFFNEDHNSLNMSSEIKISNNKNNNKYPSNEENETNHSNYKKSYTNELHNPNKNTVHSDNEKEINQNSSRISDLENEHFKTLNSTTNGIKPNINSNSTNSQINNSEESLPENNIEDSNNSSKQLNSKDNTSTKNNNTIVENKIESSHENVSKSHDNSTVNSNIVTTVKPLNTSQTNMTVNYHPNKSSEVNSTHVKTPVDESKTNKITNENQINSATENTETTNSSEPISNQNSQDSKKVPDSSNQSSKTTDNDQSGNSSSFSSLYSKLFPNGIHLSKTTILGIIGLLPMLVGLAISRFYYKKTGTDLIPFKGVFISIFSFVKSFILKFFCCCCGGLNASGTSNEKTPLLHPKNIAEPTVEKERKKRNIDDGSYNRSDISDNDDNSGEKNKDGYGSVSNEGPSPIFGSKDVKKKPGSRGKDVIDSFGAENVSKTEHSLKGKSAKDDGESKLGTIFKSKVVPAVKNIFERTGKNFDIIEREKKGVVTKFAEKNTESQFSESPKQKLDNIEQGIEKAVENVGKVISTNLSQLDEKESTGSGAKGEKSVDVERKISTSTVTAGLLNSARKNSKDKILERDTENKEKDEPNSLFQFVKPAGASKTNEAKQRFFGGDGKRKDGSDAAERDGDDPTTEYIEEIVYVDGADGDQDEEEIVEEIIETTTARGSPDSASGGFTVTKTTRKVSSSSKPGEVNTTEETVVTDGRGEKTRKRSFGLKLGIGKSGVNVSVGDKKMGVGRSGVKFGKQQDGPDAVSVGLDGSGLKFNQSTESLTKKSKKIPNFKLFKRSTSQPAGSDAAEAADVFPHTLPQTLPHAAATMPTRKSSLGSAGLLIFGKSRSKSTGFLETDDSGGSVTDVNVLSSFIDHERSASLLHLNRSASVQSLPDGDRTLPDRFLEKSSPAASEGSDVKKAGNQPKSTKKAKKKSDGVKKSTKSSKK